MFMVDTQTILTVLLTISAGLMIWYILGLRQRRRLNNSDGSKNYIGFARNPEKLMQPDEEALEELDRLMSKEFGSEE